MSVNQPNNGAGTSGEREGLPYNTRGILRFDRLTEAQIEMLANSDEEDEDPFWGDDPDDEDWQAPNEEESDVEDVLPLANMDTAVEIAEDDSDAESIEEDAESIEEDTESIDVVVPGYFDCKAEIKWEKAPPPQSQTLRHNIVRQRGGPCHTTPMCTRLDIFNKIFPNEMKHLIIRETNRKGRQVIAEWNESHPTKIKEWDPVKIIEFDAYLGILICAGVYKSSDEDVCDLWKSNANPLYRASLSRNRFKEINRFMRFDNFQTRVARLATDKAAPIRDLWLMLNANLRTHFRPYLNMTVDEQLYGYRGRTRFTQYMKSKPAKYGIKVFWLADSKTGYPLQGSIYTGREAGTVRATNIGERAVIDLCLFYKGSNRNVTADNFFASMPLVHSLQSNGLSFLGTLRKNKACIPKEMQPSKEREIFSTLFGFHDNVTICSYVPKRNKAVLLLSSMHHDIAIDTTMAAKKPDMILDYNRTKGGVDQMDQMLGTYSTKRKTNRWPLAFFYNIIDVVGLASYIFIWNIIRN